MSETTCIVYCRAWCGDCFRARMWLDRMGYEYTEVDIEEEPEYAERVRRVAGKIVTPTFEIGEHFVIGFDPHAVADALGTPPVYR